MQIQQVHTLVLGSGAAGLAAAVRLRAEGVDDVLVLTEGLNAGTSINTGSDKQTYYKLGLTGEPDSSRDLAATYLTGGSANGELALVEAAGSARAFFNLVNLGVPFPHDRYGVYPGYKTDHDPKRRASSCGPFTSREMCLALIRELNRCAVPVLENRVAVRLVTVPDTTGKYDKRCCGLLAIDRSTGRMEAWQAENVIFAVGGPGGLYRDSVYPQVHTGAIGLALAIGAAANSLPESQFGLAAIVPESNGEFRWNVSGTCMQVLPRFISTDADGCSHPREFLRSMFESPAAMNSLIFLKGYQWPFDVRKISGGSSLIDLAVHYEKTILGRRVFLDFRHDTSEFDFALLDQEAKDYLQKSQAIQGPPFARLEKMNPQVLDLYRQHGVDLARQPLEIALCAQHNNGGLAGNLWYESVNISHLFPIGEVNGSHGVARPGGSALNAGQVGAFRAAEYIAHHTYKETLNSEQVKQAFGEAVAEFITPPPSESFPTDTDRTGASAKERYHWQSQRHALQERMTRYATVLRNQNDLERAVDSARNQYKKMTHSSLTLTKTDDGSDFLWSEEAVESVRNRQLCLAHWLYLDAILFQVRSGTASRGSALVIDKSRGIKIADALPEQWRYLPENESFRSRILRTVLEQNGPRHQWLPAPELPSSDDWFENIWRDYRTEKIFIVPEKSNHCDR